MHLCPFKHRNDLIHAQKCSNIVEVFAILNAVANRTDCEPQRGEKPPDPHQRSGPLIYEFNLEENSSS